MLKKLIRANASCLPSSKLSNRAAILIGRTQWAIRQQNGCGLKTSSSNTYLDLIEKYNNRQVRSFFSSLLTQQKGDALQSQISEFSVLEKQVSELVETELKNPESEEVKIKQKELGSKIYNYVSNFPITENDSPSLESMVTFIQAIKLCLRCTMKGWIDLDLTDDFLKYVIVDRERIIASDESNSVVPKFVFDMIRREYEQNDSDDSWLLDYVLQSFKTSPLLYSYASNINMCEFIKQWLNEYASVTMAIHNSIEKLDSNKRTELEAEFYQSVFYWAYYVCSLNLFVVEKSSVSHIKAICEQYDSWKLSHSDIKINDLETGVPLSLESCMEVTKAVTLLCENNLEGAETHLKKAISLDENNIHAHGLLIRECSFNLHPEQLDSLSTLHGLISKINSNIDIMHNRQIGGEVPDSELPRFIPDTNVKANLLLHAASLVPKENKAHVDLLQKAEEVYEVSEMFCKQPFELLNAFNKARIAYSLGHYAEAVELIQELLSVKFILTEEKIKDTVVLLNLSLIGMGKAKESISMIEPYVRGMAYDIELRYTWLLAHESAVDLANNEEEKKHALTLCIEEHNKLLKALLKSPTDNKNIQAHIKHLQEKVQKLQSN